MDLFDLQAKIGLDTREYESGVQSAKKSASELRSDVAKLAQQYIKSGMDSSSAMKKAWAEIDRSAYESAENTSKAAKQTSDSWKETSTSLSGFGEKISNAFKLIGKAAVAGAGAATAAVGVLTKSSLDAYSSFEQLTGGVETLFKESADTVMEYADNAYKTAGMSANQYMETITSFTGTLLRSLDGDTAAAAEYANM